MSMWPDSTAPQTRLSPGIVERNARRRLPVPLAAGVDEPASALPVQHRHGDVRVPAVGIPVCAETLAAGVELDTSLAPEELLAAVVVEVGDCAHVAAARTGLTGADRHVPARLHPGAPALQEHVRVSALRGDEHPLAADAAAEDEVAEQAAERLLAVVVRPGPLLDRPARARIEPLQAVVADSERVLGVGVVDEVDVLGPGAVEVEREDRAEPEPRNDGRAEVALPQALPVRRDERQLERVRREEKHLVVGVVLGAGRVHEQQCRRFVGGEPDRDSP